MKLFSRNPDPCWKPTEISCDHPNSTGYPQPIGVTKLRFLNGVPGLLVLPVAPGGSCPGPGEGGGNEVGRFEAENLPWKGLGTLDMASQGCATKHTKFQFHSARGLLEMSRSLNHNFFVLEIDEGTN